MKSALTVLLQSLGGALLLTVLTGAFGVLTWGQLLGMFAAFAVGLWFFFAREMKRRQ